MSGCKILKCKRINQTKQKRRKWTEIFLFSRKIPSYINCISTWGGEALQDTKHCDELYTSVSNTLKKKKFTFSIFCKYVDRFQRNKSVWKTSSRIRVAKKKNFFVFLHIEQKKSFDVINKAEDGGKKICTFFFFFPVTKQMIGLTLKSSLFLYTHIHTREAYDTHTPIRNEGGGYYFYNGIIIRHCVVGS